MCGLQMSIWKRLKLLHFILWLTLIFYTFKSLSITPGVLNTTCGEHHRSNMQQHYHLRYTLSYLLLKIFSKTNLCFKFNKGRGGGVRCFSSATSIINSE